MFYFTWFSVSKSSILFIRFKNLTDEIIAIGRDIEPYSTQIEELTQELDRKNKDLVAQKERLSRAQIRLKKAIIKTEAEQPDHLDVIRPDIQVIASISFFFLDQSALEEIWMPNPEPNL